MQKHGESVRTGYAAPFAFPENRSLFIDRVIDFDRFRQQGEVDRRRILRLESEACTLDRHIRAFQKFCDDRCVVESADPDRCAIGGPQFFREFLRFGDCPVDEKQFGSALRGEIRRRRMCRSAAADERDPSAFEFKSERFFQRLCKPVAVGCVTVKTAAADCYRVDASGNFGFFGNLIEERDDCVFVWDRDIESGESAPCPFGEFPEFVVPDVFGEIFGVDAEFPDSGVLHGGGERMGDRVTDNGKFYHNFSFVPIVSARLSCIFLIPYKIGVIYEKSIKK